MDERYSRTAMLIGEEAVMKLRRSHVLVCGVGGVGSFICEALARAGVGHLTLLDFDTVSVSNINRQLIALTSTVGRNKAQVMAERIADIDPDTRVDVLDMFFSSENADEVLSGGFDYIADAIERTAERSPLFRRWERETSLTLQGSG